MAATSTSQLPPAPLAARTQKQAGIEPLRQPYDLRHTYATFALRAGLSAFALSRYMGTSLAMIDLHYGHLASDGREHAVALLDALAREKLVDAGWTPPPARANPMATSRAPRDAGPKHTVVDVRWTSLAQPAADVPMKGGAEQGEREAL